MNQYLGTEENGRWKSEYVATLVYIICYGYYDRNVDTDKIISLTAEWDAKDCMYTPSKLHMI